MSHFAWFFMHFDKLIPLGWAVPFNFYQSLGQGTNVFPSRVKKFFRKRCKTSDAYYGHLSIPVTSYIG